MKSQKCRGVPLTSASGRRRPCFPLRNRRKKVGMIQGKLRIRSVAGAFLILGVIVVVVGTALAVAGYWPYKLSRLSILGHTEGEIIPESQTSGWSLSATGLQSTDSLPHSERMKLLGPVIMGVGLFILICANTVLYENRDRETQMLLAQMRNVLCSVSAAVPSAGLKDIAAANPMAKHYQWVSSLPAAHLNILCLQQLTTSEPLLHTRHTTDQRDSVEGVHQQTILQTEALHHQESELPPSVHPSCSNSSIQVECNTQLGAEGGNRASFSLQAAPFIKFNVCLVSASSMSTLGVDEVAVPATQPRRCHSMPYRTSPYIARPGVRVQEGLLICRKEGQMHQQEVSTRETGSQVCVNIPGSAADVVEEQTHQSWPQLDLGSGRRYLKLDNKEDSVDRLLDQLEQQCSYWDKSFGSGPFQ
ncbi:transmembrane protein 200A [Odontesthes bonariensis]|uniref:transmembrane protein 200A n=1 Tax=Odontesthes bonariensis TaxID=219752 RepID=UPI003F58B1BF